MIDIKNGETKLFGDSVKELDKNVASEVFKNYIHYADTYKEDTSSASYLFKAADLSNGLGRPLEAIKIYERMRKLYPDYRKSSVALFMQGFIYETAVHDKEKAKRRCSATRVRLGRRPCSRSRSRAECKSRTCRR